MSIYEIINKLSQADNKLASIEKLKLYNKYEGVYQKMQTLTAINHNISLYQQIDERMVKAVMQPSTVAALENQRKALTIPTGFMSCNTTAGTSAKLARLLYSANPIESVHRDGLNVGLALSSISSVPKHLYQKYLYSFNKINRYENTLADKINASFLYRLDYDFVQYNSNTDKDAEVKSLIIKPEVIIKESSDIRKTIVEIYRNNPILTRIGHREFEELTAELLRIDGYEVELTKKTCDGGRDIIALHKLGDIPYKLLVECKHYQRNKIGVDVIRGFSYVVNKENATGLIVTSSYFTKGARDEVKNPLIMNYKDKDDVIDWVNRNAPLLLQA